MSRASDGDGDWDAYALTSGLRKEPSRLIDENVRQVALLVHDACELALVVVPRRGWLPGESLNTTKGCVLNENYREVDKT